MTISELIADAIANGGGTFYRDPFSEEWVNAGGIHKQGYYVSAPVKYEFKVRELLSSDLFAFARRYFLWGEENNQYLGLWFNEADGYWYVDISHHFEDIESAYAMAVRNDQLAFWDITEGEEIRVA